MTLSRTFEAAVSLHHQEPISALETLWLVPVSSRPVLHATCMFRPVNVSFPVALLMHFGHGRIPLEGHSAVVVVVVVARRTSRVARRASSSRRRVARRTSHVARST